MNFELISFGVKPSFTNNFITAFGIHKLLIWDS